MALQNYAIPGLLGVLAIVWFLIPRRTSKSSLPLPPGPKKLPFIGNVLDLPTKDDWLTYHEWSLQYNSDIIHLDAVGQSIIVLDSYDSVIDLLEKRSDIYSSRPHAVMAYDLIGWNQHLAFKKYGEDWRLHRKVFAQEFTPSTSLRYRAKEREFTHVLLRNILDDKDQWLRHIKLYGGSIILSIAYDINPKSDTDIYLVIADQALVGLNFAATPGSFLVDVMPFLKHIPAWFPGAGFQRKAKKWRKDMVDMIEIPFKIAKERIDNGTAAPSYLSYALDNMDPDVNTDEQVELIKNTSSAMFSAGVDTTAGILVSLILAMVWYPEVQAKAQEELDRVVGEGNLPDFGEEDSLPYCQALIMELLRWKPVVPVSIPRMVEREDVYRGYRIPAGSVVIPNFWAILHNPRDYPQPSSFDPERFLRNGKINPDVLDPALVFGIGRRICPGRFMAQSSLWITVTSLLATFNITKATDDDGSTIKPSGEAYGRFVHRVLPFKCNFEPRSSEIERLVRASAGL